MSSRTLTFGSTLLACAAFGQSPTPPARRTFEVASIKPNLSGRPMGTTVPLEYLPSGRFTATNVTLVDVIVQAYQTRRIQMQGGPDWIDSVRFDIVAKADTSEGEVKEDQLATMIQTLLEDRFKLVFHRETKQMPVLALVGKRPEAFRVSKEGKASFMPGDHGQWLFQNMPMAGLVNMASNMLQTPVVDATGIEGLYDFTLDLTASATRSVERVDGTPPNRFDLLETALREQLGFKLERRKAPLEIMVIDSASKPSDN